MELGCAFPWHNFDDTTWASVHTLTIHFVVSIHPSVRPSVGPSVRLSVCPSVRLPVYLSISLSVYLSICLSFYLSVCPSIYLSLCLSLRLCLSVCVSVCLPVCLSVCVSLSVSLSVSVCRSVRPSIHVSIRTCACQIPNSKHHRRPRNGFVWKYDTPKSSAQSSFSTDFPMAKSTYFRWLNSSEIFIVKAWHYSR